MRALLKATLFVLLAHYSFAQIPAGYYDNAEGQTGYSLKTTLYNIINDHTDLGYSALWTIYEESDVRADGKVWDMYSDCNFTFVTDQDGGSGGTVECDKYNREHTFPQSWFGGSGTIRNDAFHVIPADKKVNGVRGNFAFGEVTNATYTSLNGSKLGPNTISGHSGTVFEPIDEYKGDIARGLLYVATRYQNLIAGWEANDSDGDAMLNGTSDQVFETWAMNMLIEWHTNDPVSQKEIDRNNAIYSYQGNRNPFIDHPEYVACIWLNQCENTPTPTITLTESLTDFGSVNFGEVSATQQYTIAGSDLTTAITITASESFEISLVDNAVDFTNEIVLAPTAGAVSTTTIFVRFNPITDANAAVNGIISHTCTGAVSQTINVSGTENTTTNGTPQITIDASLSDFGSVDFGNVSASQQYSVEAADLTEDLVITASESFEIALTDTDADFTNQLILTPTDGAVATTTIFVRFNPASDANGIIDGTITHTSTGASTKTITISGVEHAEAVPTITVNENLVDFGEVLQGARSALQQYTVSASLLTGNLTITAPASFLVGLQDDEQAFDQTVVLAPTNGEITETAIFVVFAPSEMEIGTINGNITHETVGATSQTIAVSGTATEPIVPQINFSFQSRATELTSSFEVTLFSSETPNKVFDLSVQLGQNSTLNYGTHFTTVPAMNSGQLTINWQEGNNTATFDIVLNEVAIDNTQEQQLIFEIGEQTAYTIGDNHTFTLSVLAEEVINGVDKVPNGWMIYPNPATNQLSFEGISQPFEYTITDLTGKILLSEKGSGNIEIGLNDLNEGIYILIINSGKEKLITRINKQ